MNLIRVITEQDITRGAAKVDPRDFRVRQAARAVVLDGAGRVPLLKVGKYNYHKLPGGGVDSGENVQQALERELLEEIGASVEVISEIGTVTEYRDQFQLKQDSFCYLAQQKGETGEPSFTQKELSEEFSIIWVANIDKAIALLGADEPTNYEGKFIQKRDIVILESAKKVKEDATL